ncbi:MAG: hypothetical protein AAF658_03510, partial [Myxococcota bacterium]
EPSGHVRDGALADLDLARAALLTRPYDISPCAATAWGVLVEAPALARCHYVDASRTLGLNVRALDEFSTPHARDIDVGKVVATAISSHPPITKQLSHSVRLLDLDFLQETPSDQQYPQDPHCSEWTYCPRRGPLEAGAAASRSHVVEATAPGTAHALLIWWHLRFGESVISTVPSLDGEASLSHWRAAAYILNRGTGIGVRESTTLRLRTCMRHSHMFAELVS